MRGNRRRKVALIALVLIVVFLGVIVSKMIADIRSQPVSYRVSEITPVNSYLCPGDVLLYDVEVAVSQVKIPSILTFIETWCQAGVDGVCAQTLTTVSSVPSLAERNIFAMARRTVPESAFFRPGREYEFWHATRTDDGKVTGYRVTPIHIRDNCGEISPE